MADDKAKTRNMLNRLGVRPAELLAILLWGIACWLFFQFYYPYHFFYQEQNQLFLLTGEYLQTYFRQPAWLACMIGDFLTQFYYYLYAGAAILTLTLLTVGDLARRALQRAGVHRLLAFAVAIILMTIEAVFCFKTEYRLSSIVAIGGGLASYLLCSYLFRYGRWVVAIVLVVASFLVYWMFGYGLWVFQALVIIDSLLHKRSKSHLWNIAFLGAPVALAIIILTSGLHGYNLNADRATTYPGLGKWALPDFILEKDLAADNEYYFGNHHKVEQMVENDEHPTDEMLYFYNLVQAQKGELPDKLLKFSPNQLGTFYAIGPETSRLTIINMNELYWALGDMTLTERAAMMTNVFSPFNRNVRMIKRLAECNIVSGDTLAANKYLRLLSKTLVYRGWARRMMDKDAQSYQYIQQKQAFTNKADTIRLSDNLHMVMMELLDSNPDNTVALDYILCSTLLLKDISNFKRDYDRYCHDIGRDRLKPIYQQALTIYLAGTNAPQEEWQEYIRDPQTLTLFAEYNQQRGNPKYKDTYWYYFDTAKPIKP